MRYYSVINLLRQNSGPFTVTDKWIKEAETMNDIKYKVIGECDANGNLMHQIANGNFTKANEAPTPEIFNDVKEEKAGKPGGKGKRGKATQ
jgi:hypothetical protein